MLFVHMIGGIYTLLRQKRINGIGGAFKVNDVGQAPARNAENGAFDVHYDRKPFAVIPVAKHRVHRCRHPRVFGACAVCIQNMLFELLPCHFIAPLSIEL